MAPFIDINCHLFTAQGDRTKIFRQLVAAPDVRAIVVSGADLKLDHSPAFPYMSSCFRTTNEEVLRLVERVKSSRLIPFCFIDPTEETAVRDLEAFVTRRGMKGVKMYPPRGWHVDDPRAMRVFEAAQAVNVPVFLHMGRTAPHPQLDSNFGRPLRLEKVGLRFPKLKVLIGHFASPWTAEALEIALGFPNFFLDLSTSGAWDVPLLRRVAQHPDFYPPDHGLKRLVYGSNGDGENNLAIAARVRAALLNSGFNEEECDTIFLRNAARILGLSWVETADERG
ncbi:MAG TPA: amidohydrolase family protein [Planctomycetota bacterium]|nr:amidohydrolase family protein [Planctomycetota bacterium]